MALPQMLGAMGNPVPPRSREGLTIPRYHPVSRLWKSPWRCALFIGAWWPGHPLAAGYRIVAGRLWVSTGSSSTVPGSGIHMLPVDWDTSFIDLPTPTPPQSVGERNTSPRRF